MSEFTLDFGFPVPGATPHGGLYRVTWRGTAVMGILNVTPDSFSDGGAYPSIQAAVAEARKMRDAGALIIDIGGESTRPGAEPVPADEEMHRILPVLEAIAAEGDILLSVDTQKPEVARAALAAGAHLINDVNGLRDPKMRDLCAHFRAPAVIMHRKGDAKTMQKNPFYQNLYAEVYGFLEAQDALARSEGVPDVIRDPGIGFGKTREQNLQLLNASILRSVSATAKLLIGASRKRLIDYLAGVPIAANRDPGSLAIHLHAAQNGAAMVRVHNVPAHVQALRVSEQISGRNEG